MTLKKYYSLVTKPSFIDISRHNPTTVYILFIFNALYNIYNYN